MNSLRTAGIMILILVLTFGVFVFATLWSTGQFRKLSAVNMEQCRPIEGIVGAEDIALDEELGIALFSSFDRRRAALVPDVNGAIVLLSYLSPDAKPVALQLNNAPKKFRPHGLSLFKDPSGIRYLYVVNHPEPNQSQIDVFRLMSNGQLNHLKSIGGHPLLVSVNDLVVVGKDQFYFTNDAGHRANWRKTLGRYLRLADGSIGYYDNGTFYLAADDLVFANGIAVNRDGTRVFVAETTGQKLHIYRRSLNTNALTRISAIPMGSNLDNLFYDRDGRLWIGAHPKIVDLMSHAQDAEKLSPSQVIEIEFLESEQVSISTKFLSLGEELSGSSVSVRSGDIVLIGSIFDDRVLHCTLDAS